MFSATNSILLNATSLQRTSAYFRIRSVQCFLSVPPPARAISRNSHVSLFADRESRKDLLFTTDACQQGVKVAFPQAVQDATYWPITTAVLELRKQGYRVHGISERAETNAPLACDGRNVKWTSRASSSAAAEQGSSFIDPFR